MSLALTLEREGIFAVKCLTGHRRKVQRTRSLPSQRSLIGCQLLPMESKKSNVHMPPSLLKDRYESCPLPGTGLSYRIMSLQNL